MKSARSKTILIARLLGGLAPLLVAGCVVGPNYQKPEVAHPEQFRSAITPADAASLADLPWWQVFQDPQLESLIRAGLANNPDIAIAVSRIEQARAYVGVAKSAALPQVGYQAAAGGERTVTAAEHDIGAVSYGSVGGGLSAAWELDIWGRIKRQTESARAHLLAQEEVKRAVMLTLVSDIAAGYFRLAELDRALAISQESEGVFQKMQELFALRNQAGRDSRLPAERAQALWDSSRARSADLRRQITQQENAIAILTGGFPQPITRGVPLTGQAMPATPVGLTTDLLLRRPDIRQAEQVMVGANAEIGVAVANFYPRIGLSTLLGFIGINAEGGFNGTFGLWRGVGGIAGPIFTGGRLESVYQARKAFWDEAVANYRKTVLVAFQETSDALAAQETLATQRAALEAQIQALRRSVDLATERYRGGRASYFEVLEAQQQLYPAEADLAQAQEAQLQAVVKLYKALGGGWNLTDAQYSGRSGQ
ncbi:MAG TPA: efflux transporter outer membrane subunit [Allosphingosinicella sp.]|nr:efflux transporter outer membrane subunit [Allosphingosinicella sp.]